MRFQLPRLQLMILGATALLALAPGAAANSAKPSSGTTFMVNPGDRETILIGGLQGCTFMVAVMTSDSKVASVNVSSALAKKHKVEITAEGPGTATIQIMTLGSSNPSCSGFFFDYTMVVEPDPAAFFKQAKGKLKEAIKGMKSTANSINKDYCNDLAALGKAVKSGQLSVDDAISEAFDSVEEFATYYHVDLNDFLESVFDDIWDRSLDAGFTGITNDMLGLLPGGCGEWDKFEKQADQVAMKALKLFRKKFKKFQKALEKSAKGDDAEVKLIISDPAILLGVNIPVPLPAPMPPVLPPAPAKQVTRSWTGSGHLDSSPSRLRIGGSADPAAGMVTVKINGPDGFTATMMVMPGTDCGWTVEFPNLPTGSYTVEMSQNGEKATEFGTTVV